MEVLFREARQRRRRRWIRAGIAVGIILLVGLAIVLGHRSIRPSSQKGQPHPASHASATPADCVAGQLEGAGSWQGATGTMLGRVDLTNVSDQSCGLSGYLNVSLISQSGSVLPVTIQHATSNASGGVGSPIVGAPRALVLVPGRSASFLIQWQNWCGPPPGQLSVRAALPNGQSMVVAPTMPWGVTNCLSPSSKSYLAVGPLQ